MLKAVVFDDEYIVLQGLKTMIDWGQYGIEMIGTADNGLSALQMFRDIRPDIVLTDIRMPGMDGLQLIETAAAEAPEAMFIVFSGFNEFEYVRRAIGLGVVDYLEKPITVSNIDKAVQKAIERIRLRQAYSTMQVKWNASQAELLEKATLDLLLLGEKVVSKWRESFGAEWTEVLGVTVAAFSSERAAIPIDSSYRVVEVTNGDEILSVIFHFQLPASSLFEHLSRLASRTAAVFSSGCTYTSLTDTPKSYREALRALRFGKFHHTKGWITIQDVKEGQVRTEELATLQGSLLSCLRRGDREGLGQAFERIKRWTQTDTLSPDQIEREMLKLVYIGMEAAKEPPYNRGIFGEAPHRELSALDTREEMVEWMLERMEKLCAWIEEARIRKKHPAILKALTIIEERYGHDLSLQELAEQVGLNSAYFSLLFKEETGSSYIKYLTSFRIERAKALLQEGMRVNEASEKVGYCNYRHFSEIFKKHVGMTPGRYRDIHHTGS
ncbi:response regulator [Paenibacillus medicaginis]|uniref:Response regulator n=1 Tax=Paenibacillus medicaginis TaxID=1470560 RepID=A0ABV5BYM3_9BACL